MRSTSIWNLEVLVCEERGKPEYLGKTSRSKGEHQQQNSTFIWRQRCRELNPGHIGWRRVLSPLGHPCSPSLQEVVDVVFQFILGNCVRVYKLNDKSKGVLIAKHLACGIHSMLEHFITKNVWTSVVLRSRLWVFTIRNNIITFYLQHKAIHMFFDMEIINSSLFLPAMRAQSVVKNIPFPHSGIASKLS